MFKQLLLSILGGLLIILGIFYAILVPGLAFLGGIVVILGLYVILFSALSRRTLCFRKCFFVNAIIVLLGIALIFTGSFIIFITPALFIIGLFVVFFGFIVLALGILLMAEC
ncbi:hypothetical protein KHQ82_10500 [Mycoplasmatota bacterium]|nr:hypothetical protein KHQ82_10500 [Mycoplasmatota bacterium]